jgi:hypothetical protein
MEETRWERTPKDNLATEIANSPPPAGWEARRTKFNDVYFINSEEDMSTACLWREVVPRIDDTSTKITPIPAGWTMDEVKNRVVYKSPAGELMETPPEPDNKATFQNVIKSKEHCQLLDFFPQHLIDQYEKDTKLPEPAPAIPR